MRTSAILAKKSKPIPKSLIKNPKSVGRGSCGGRVLGAKSDLQELLEPLADVVAEPIALEDG